MAQIDPKAVNRWTARFIPVVLMGAVGYATYVLVVRLCIKYLLRQNHRHPGAVIAILVIYFVLFLLMATSYFRVLYIVTFDPGFIPRGPLAQKSKKVERNQRRGSRHGTSDRSHNSFGREYRSSEMGVEPDTNPDSPGLEQFYTKDVFVCNSDGRPKWCSDCSCWKPDRAHHCSDIGRCVRKMDHFCPWVGGVVAENSFKFFIQFVTYTFLYCTFLVIVMAIYLHQQIDSNDPRVSLDPQFAAIIGLGSFFGLFTCGMTVSSMQFAMCNLTTIENLNKKTKVWQLAVIIPNTSKTTPANQRPENISTDYTTVTYPLPLMNEKPPRDSDQVDIIPDDPSMSESSNSSPNFNSERDSRAKRTFAILRMEPGQSPFDLGASQNWKSVMGNTLLDWMLPVYRSPCCNHESPESQFVLGRWVEELRAKHGLLPRSEVRSPYPRARRRQERLARQRAKDIEMQNIDDGALR